MTDYTQDDDFDENPSTEPVIDSPAPGMVPRPLGPSLNPAVVAHLNGLMARKPAASDDTDDEPDTADAAKAALASAQKTSALNQLYAGLARAGGTLAHSAYGTTQPMNTGAYDALDKAAQAPVETLQAQQMHRRLFGR